MSHNIVRDKGSKHAICILLHICQEAVFWGQTHLQMFYTVPHMILWCPVWFRGDWLVQKSIEGRKELDGRRTAAMGATARQTWDWRVESEVSLAYAM